MKFVPFGALYKQKTKFSVNIFVILFANTRIDILETSLLILSHKSSFMSCSHLLVLKSCNEINKIKISKSSFSSNLFFVKLLYIVGYNSSTFHKKFSISIFLFHQIKIV
jgi:hypothetical protein